MAELYDILKSNFSFNKETNITVDTFLGGDPEWTSIGTLTKSVKANEVHMFGISLAWNYDTANKSAQLRYTIDGGTTWFTSQEEAKDKTDTRHMTYAFPIEFASDTDVDFRVEVTKESDDHTLTIEYCDITIERKG